MLRLNPTVLDKLNRKEHYLFYAALLFHLTPLLITPLFITLDGPAHLYNGTIIRDLLLNKSSVLAGTFELRTGVLPNWTGHALLAALSSVLPAYLAEKLVQVLIISGLAFGWRRYILHQGGNAWLSFLIFPFLHSYFFTLGFYNFLIGIALLPFALVSIDRMLSEKVRWSHWVKLFLWLLLLYFSHLVVFALTLGIASLMWLISVAKSRNKAPRETRQGLNSALTFLAAAALPSWWVLRYFAERQHSGEPQYLDSAQLWQMIIDMVPLISFNFESEVVLLRIFLAIIVALLLLGIVLTLRRHAHENQATIAFRFRSFTLLAAAALCMALYWLLPDVDAQAGFISSRMLFMSLLFLAVWLALQPFGKLTSMASGLSTLALSMCLVLVNASIYRNIMNKGNALMEAGRLIPEGSILLPVNMPADYLLEHASNYLGAISEGVVILHNYEAENSYFPLKWNEAEMPHFQLLSSGPEAYPCAQGPSEPENDLVSITHLMRWDASGSEVLCTEMQAIFERPEVHQIYGAQGFSVWEIRGLE